MGELQALSALQGYLNSDSNSNPLTGGVLFNGLPYLVGGLFGGILGGNKSANNIIENAANMKPSTMTANTITDFYGPMAKF